MITQQKIFFFLALYFLIATPGFCQEEEASASVLASKEIRTEALFTEGEKYFILEDYGKAIEYFRRANELSPSGGIHYKIAESLSKSERNEDLEQAVIEIEKAIKLDGANKFYYLLGSRVSSAIGRFDQATTMLEVLVEKFPGNVDQLFELSTLYQIQSKQDKALEALNRAEKILGVNETSSIRKMELLGGMGKFKQAEEESRKLIEAFPDEPRYLSGLASLLIQQGKSNEARSLLEKIQPSDDEEGFARLLLADLYIKAGDLKRCMELALVLMGESEMQVNNKIILIKSIQAGINARDPEVVQQLVQLTDRLKISEPDIPEVWLTSADLFMATGNQRAAVADYRKAIKKGANVFQAWSNLLILESQENMADSLILHSEEAMEYFPNQPELWYFNGFGHFKKKSYKAACSSFEQARLLSSDEAFKKDILLLLGDAYHASGNHAKSDESFEEVLKADPEQDLALNNYSYYLSLRKEKLDRAEELSGKLIKKFPTNNTYLDTHAWVLFAKGKFKEARKVMEQVIRSGGASATHLEHYGDILFKLGETDEAVKQWELALSLNSRNDGLRKKILNRKLN